VGHVGELRKAAQQAALRGRAAAIDQRNFVVVIVLATEFVAEAALVSLEQMNGDLGAYQYGQILAQIGEIDRAFAALDRAWAVRDPGLQTLRADPFVDPLRGDPRFKALEAKLNFPA